MGKTLKGRSVVLLMVLTVAVGGRMSDRLVSGWRLCAGPNNIFAAGASVVAVF